MNKLSVIITCYNSENTIERAIVSVCQQTYNNIEIIVVDDCSTDNSNSIIKNLCTQYPNIRLIRHNVNKGCGLARRTGIKEATGDYIGFLDSDDYLHNQFYEVLVNLLEYNNADIVWSVPYVLNNNDIPVLDTEYNYEVHTESQIFEAHTQYKKWLNAGITKRELWDNVEYSASRYIEDTPTIYKIMHRVNKGIFTDYQGYYYVTNPNSLCHTSSELKNQLFSTLAMIDILKFDVEEGRQPYINKDIVIDKLKSIKPYIVNASYRELFKYRKQIIDILKFLIELL